MSQNLIREKGILHQYMMEIYINIWEFQRFLLSKFQVIRDINL